MAYVQCPTDAGGTPRGDRGERADDRVHYVGLFSSHLLLSDADLLLRNQPFPTYAIHNSALYHIKIILSLVTFDSLSSIPPCNERARQADGQNIHRLTTPNHSEIGYGSTNATL